MTEYKLPDGKTLQVIQDEFLNSPREWDNLTKMIFFGRNAKHLGDDHDIELSGDFNGREEFIVKGAEEIRKKLDAAIVVPVHIYSHSGETISTSYGYPYNCRWDSGTIGFAVVTKEDIRKEYSTKRITKKHIELARGVLEAEVKTLDQYIRGDVYGFKVINADGEHEDSCWGFYGSDPKENGMYDHIGLTSDVVLEEI